MKSLEKAADALVREVRKLQTKYRSNPDMRHRLREELEPLRKMLKKVEAKRAAVKN